MSTIKGSCTLVRDFTDFSFHSYFSLVDDLSEIIGDDETPLDVKYVINNKSFALRYYYWQLNSMLLSIQFF